MTNIPIGSFLACNEDLEKCCIYDSDYKRGSCIDEINVKKIRGDAIISVERIHMLGSSIVKVESKDRSNGIDCASVKKKLACILV